MQQHPSHSPSSSCIRDNSRSRLLPHCDTAVASYGGMSDRAAPLETGEAGSSTPIVYPPSRASSPPAPFSTDRPPSPTIRQRNGKAKEKPDSADPSQPTRPRAPATAPRNRSRWGGLVFELENRGSVARDHLAGERTFLAWLRTSLGLASIGIAITQLFRLPSTSTTNAPAAPEPSSVGTADPAASISSAIAALETSSPSLAALVPILEAQQAQLVAAQAMVRDSTKYRHLGKPIGGTFIMLALVFLFLGIHRYFAVQTALMREPSQFPPSRRSVGFGAFCVAALVLASFVAILATR
ncbi:hypothetical protein JCM3770_003588 [Rhodotorula araucariae]